jgi:PST family polysaccharide transporter
MTESPFDPPGKGEGLGARGVRASGHVLAFSVARFGVQLLSLAVLARLLSPADYGLMGMIATATGFAALFRDMGLSTATIQNPRISHPDVNDAFWINTAAGAALAVLLGLTSPLVASFYGEPRMLAALPVVSLAFVASGLSVQHSAILRRRLQFFRIGLAETVAAVVSLAVSLSAALLGAGYWALVVSPLVLEVTTCILLWALCPWRPTRPGRLASSRRLLHVGGHMLGMNVLSYLSSSLDRILVGRFLGAVELGVYTRSSALVALPTQQLVTPVSSVMLPMFSRLCDHADRYRTVILSSMRLMVAVTAPAVALMIACGDWIVALVLGARWMATAAVIPPLAIIAATQFIPNNLGLILVVAGRFRALLVWNAVHLVGVGLAMGVGLRYGLVGVATGYALVVTVLRVPVLFHMVGSASPARASSLWAVCLPFWIISAGMGLAVAALRCLLPPVGPLAGLLLAATVAGAVYAGLLALTPAGRDLWRDVRRVFRDLTPARAPAANADPPATP